MHLMHVRRSNGYSCQVSTDLFYLCTVKSASIPVGSWWSYSWGQHNANDSDSLCTWCRVLTFAYLDSLFFAFLLSNNENKWGWIWHFMKSSCKTYSSNWKYQKLGHHSQCNGQKNKMTHFNINKSNMYVYGSSPSNNVSLPKEIYLRLQDNT